MKEEKIKIGIFGLTCCAGEELNVTNLEEELADIAEIVDLRHYLMVQSINEFPVDIALVAGFVATKEDEMRLKEIRKNSRYLIAFGSCASSCGGVHGLRMKEPLSAQYREVYGDVKMNGEIAPLSEIRPIDSYVEVDYYIRGCPVPEEEILYYIFKFIRAPPVKNELLPVNIQTEGYGKIRGDAFSLDPEKCVLCRRCVNICQKHIGQGVIDFISRGGGAKVVVSTFFGESFENAGCILCGQCITSCPVGAYQVRSDVERVKNILANPDNFTVAILDPMSCTSMMQHFSREEDFYTYVRRVIASLRKIGFDKVISFTEGYHLSLIHQARHIMKGDEHEKIAAWCPAAQNLIKKSYRELIRYITFDTDPLYMLMRILRETFGPRAKYVLITPCVAYKNTDEVDAVLTAPELRRLLSYSGIDVDIEKPDRAGFDRECFHAGEMEIMNTYPLGPMSESLLWYLTLFMREEGEVKRIQIEKGVEEIVMRIGETTKKALFITVPAKLKKYVVRMGDYDYVEIVPCFGGCAGGGGHYPPATPEKIEERRKMIEKYNERIISKLNRWAMSRAYELMAREGFRCPV